MRIAVDDGEIDVLDEGQGAALVLLHGFPLSRATWDAQAASLRKEYRVIRPDLRGLGDSSVPPGPYLMESVAGDIAAVLDALGVERATVVGHSLGAYVAFAFLRLFTERVAGLGIVAGRADADDAASLTARMRLAAEVEARGAEPLVEFYVPKYFGPPHDEPDSLLRRRATEAIRRADPRGAAAMLRGIAARVASDDLFEDIDVPVWIAAGKDDNIMSLAHNQAMAQAIRGAELEVLACGHFPLWETPDELSAGLRRLMGRVERVSVS